MTCKWEETVVTAPNNSLKNMFQNSGTQGEGTGIYSKIIPCNVKRADYMQFQNLGLGWGFKWRAGFDNQIISSVWQETF